MRAQHGIFAPRTVAITTLGCKSNVYDSGLIRSAFENHGYTVVPFSEKADVYVVNTCTVTDKADRESRQLIYQARRRNPEAKVVAAGCAAQINPAQFIKRHAADYIFGQSLKEAIPKWIDTHDSGTYISNISHGDGLSNALDLPSLKHRAILKVQDGCNSQCAFCVIYQARGTSRSLPIATIVDQLKGLLALGHKEIVLTGVNLAQYGRDHRPKTTFCDLLRALIAIPGDFRIRISSIDPFLLSSEFIDLVASTPKVCRHFHISIQNPNDTILRRMNRGPKFHKTHAYIQNIIESMPDACIGFDVIAGFPGESEALFNETMTRLQTLPFTYMHVFPFSRRPTAKAESLDGHLPPKVIKARAKALRMLSFRKKRAFYGNYIGQTLRIIPEPLSSNRWKGFTDNYLHVEGELAQSPHRPSEFIQVRLDKLIQTETVVHFSGKPVQ